MGNKKFYIRTFGCQMNFADSDVMTEFFKKNGFELSNNLKDSDYIIVNSCSVRQHAEDRALSFLGKICKFKKFYSAKKIIFSGCVAERLKTTLKQRFPLVDYIISSKEFKNIEEILTDILQAAENKQSGTISVGSDTSVAYQFSEGSSLFPIRKATPDLIRGLPYNFYQQSSRPTSQSITIMRGCNFNCSFCVVPLVRGKEEYIPLKEVLQKIKDGVKEIVLLGQTVNSYKYSENGKSYDFADLLNIITDENPQLKRLRFISPHPCFFNNNLIETITKNEKIPKHIHLPVQSGSNKILKLMNRNYTRERFLEIVYRLKELNPQISITTDLIVGFPDESEKDFQQTLSLVDEVKFDYAFCFKFSPRPKTKADNLPYQIPQEVINQRHKILLDQINKIASENAKKLLNTQQEVLLTEFVNQKIEVGARVWNKKRFISGTNFTSFKVIVDPDGLKIGDIVKVRIKKNYNRLLYGEVIE